MAEIVRGKGTKIGYFSSLESVRAIDEFIVLSKNERRPEFKKKYKLILVGLVVSILVGLVGLVLFLVSYVFQ
jgi:preprotein translocase subunit Sss1